MVEQLLLWPPVLWAARTFILLVLIGGTLVCLLSLARFVRPKHKRAMLTADLPIFRGFGASAEIMGQHLEVNATLDTRRDEQLDIINSRINELERVVQETVEDPGILSGGSEHGEE